MIGDCASRTVLPPLGLSRESAFASQAKPAATIAGEPRRGHHVFTESECWPDDPAYEIWLYERETHR